MDQLQYSMCWQNMQEQRNSEILGVSRWTLSKAVKEGKKFDWFKLMGLDDMPPEKKEFIINTANEMLSNLSSIADGMIENYQRQIDKKQEVIDQYNNELSDLESQLEDEKNLREEGSRIT